MSTASFVRATVVLPVRQLPAAIDFYEQALGFRTEYLNRDPDDDPEGNYAILRRDGAEMHLILDEPPRDHPWTTAGTGYLFLIVRGVDAVFEAVRRRQTPIRRGLETESWGARAFQLTDPSGNLILVAEAVDSAN